ncbi:MAG TPA: hypothetical protein VF081_14220 [Solirubrobacterales bacterium]
MPFRTAIATLLAATAVAVAAPAATQPTEAQAFRTTETCREWELSYVFAEGHVDLEYFYLVLLERYCWGN